MKQSLLIEKGKGYTTNEEEQVKHVTSFFSTFFNNKNKNDPLDAKPWNIIEPFTSRSLSVALNNSDYLQN